MIDELAYAANMDPVAFRLAQMSDPRWIATLNAATKAANWQPKVAASSLSKANVVTGRGVALAPRSSSLAAVVADIEVNKKTGKILVKHMYASQDAGLTVYPSGVESQMMGGVIQSVSRSLSEVITFTKTRVSSNDWVTYPLLRFKDHPNVTLCRGPADRPRPGRLGRAAGGADAGRDRERVLRRDRRAHPAGADDAGPCPGGAEGSRRELGEPAARGRAGSATGRARPATTTADNRPAGDPSSA